MIDNITIRAPLSELLPGMDKQQELRWLRAWDVQTSSGFPRWYRNPTPQEKQSGKYYPTLTAYKDRAHYWRPVIKMQFSVAKLFWGNNLNELENSHLLPVASKLQERLIEMGLRPSREVLLRASVVNLHYSKNILLEHGHVTSQVIQHLNRIQAGGRLQKRNMQYARGGSGINLYNKSFCFSIYDKLEEVESTLEVPLDSEGRKLEVLRLEARLENKDKLNHIFEKLDIGHNPTFQEVFDSEKSRRVVTHIWQTLVAPQAALVTDSDDTANDIIQKIMRHIPNITLHKAIKVTSMVMSARTPGGLSELKTIVLNHKNQRMWARLYQEIKEANQAMETEETDWWQQVETQLAEYEPLALIEN